MASIDSSSPVPEEGCRREKSRRSQVYSVDSFCNGIAFGQQQLEEGGDPREYFALRLQDQGEVVPLRSRYILNKTNPFHELESSLMSLSKQGVLRTARIYFGTTTDPFYPFEGKFDSSMRFLELFNRYTPGMLYLQTRSPLLVIAMPVLRKLGKHVAVTIGIETPSNEVVRRYTPGLPRIEERLKAASALRRFGVEVTLQVSPVLPYGDWKNDAEAFATMLAENGDYVFVQPLSDGTEKVERKVRQLPLAKKLSEDRRYHWLRLDAANPLITALEAIAPEKLEVPKRPHLEDRQLDMFAA